MLTVPTGEALSEPCPLGTSGGGVGVAGSWSELVCLLPVLAFQTVSDKRLSQDREDSAVPWACGFHHGASSQQILLLQSTLPGVSLGAGPG